MLNKWILVSNSQREGEEEDAEEETQPTKNIPSKERFLQNGSDGLWVLGPLPALGAAQNTDLATSFHTYITQCQADMTFYLLDT